MGGWHLTRIGAVLIALVLAGIVVFLVASGLLRAQARPRRRRRLWRR